MWTSIEKNWNRIATEVDVWHVDPAKIDAALLRERFGDFAPEPEILRIEQFASAALRHQQRVTRLLCRWCLSQYVACELIQFVTAQNEFGKPFIVRPNNSVGLQFNLSHDDLIACAVTRISAVGLDVMRRDTTVNIEALNAYFFSPAERTLVDKKTDPAWRNTVALGIWVYKESFLKATGQGFSTPPDTINIYEKTKLSISLPDRWITRPFSIGNGVTEHIAAITHWHKRSADKRLATVQTTDATDHLQACIAIKR